MQVQTSNQDGFIMALDLIKSYKQRPAKADVLLQSTPNFPSSQKKKFCQHFFYGVLRSQFLLEFLFKGVLKKKPNVALEALLFMGAFELIGDKKDKTGPIIHFYVEKAKGLYGKTVAGFVNAVLRRALENWKQLLASAQMLDPLWLSRRYSHPLWLVKRWLGAFGAENTQKMLEWNQLPAAVYAHIPAANNEIVLEGWEKTEWAHFYVLQGNSWVSIEPLLESGEAYIQDPATRFVAEYAPLERNSSVLDLCSAPGGKAFQLMRALDREEGLMVMVDGNKKRMIQLAENVAKWQGCKKILIEHDVLKLSPEIFESKGLCAKFDCVLLDAPCSNTGVLKRRPDAKMRLKESDITQNAQLQESLLLKAALFVQSGGRLVYSTCSIESEENESVVRGFLKKAGGQFTLEREHTSYPWSCQHDGAYVCALNKIKG